MRAEADRLRSGAAPRGFTVDGIALTPSPQSEADIFFPGCRQYRGGDHYYVWCPQGHARPSFGGTADRTAYLGAGWYVLY